MALNKPVRSGPGAGRAYAGGSRTELKLDGGHTDGGWAIVESHPRAGDEPRLLITRRRAGADYCLLPRDDADVGPERFVSCRRSS